MSSTSSAVCFCLCFVIIAAQDLYEGDICRTVRGTQWTCKMIKQCPKAMQMLQSGKRPIVCGFKNREPIVCCEPETTFRPPITTTTKRPVYRPPKTTTTRRPTYRPPQPPKTTTTRRPIYRPPQTTTTRRPVYRPPQTSSSGEKARQMCKKYADYVFITVPGWDVDDEQKIDTCNQLEALIVGGKDARPREFPHMAQIGYGDQPNIIWKCGGSLISVNYVVSAAHCTEVYRKPAMWVKLGDFNIRTKDDEITGDANPVIHRIAQRINHPQYTAKRREHDIALYKLATNVEFNEYIRPICLQTETTIRRTYAVACGWGDVEYGGPASDVLQKVNVTLITPRECSGYYPPQADTLPNGIQGDSMICAGDTISYKDACQGDSGGPLQVSHPDFYCVLNLVGITSFGHGCGTLPGVYTRVSYYVPWIESIVWK